MTNATCPVEGCERPILAKGLCGAHYARWKRHGDPEAGGPIRVTQRKPREKNVRICAVDGCGKLVKARGWCQSHYQRWRQHGDPEGGRAAPRSRAGHACKVGDCEEPANGGLGWCKRHYQKYYKAGDPLAPDKYTRRGAPLRERLEAKVAKTDHCWFWLGHINGSGYGVIGVGGKARLAHRVSYEVFVGPIPDGLVIDHLCRNRACIAPTHLQPVTQEVNVRRGASTERGTHCGNGHEFTKANTRWVRVCATCSDVARERWKARKSA